MASPKEVRANMSGDSTEDLADVPLLEKDKNGQQSITAAGHEYLSSIVTDSEENVYAILDGFSPVTAAAAMARLSRRSDDLRVILLDEFMDASKSKDENLLRRVITAYGDDSVQQLAGQHLVVEKASNLMTKKLEWGRVAIAYLEQSTRYIRFDQPGQDGRYKYHIPAEIHSQPSVEASYIGMMDQIFDNYSLMIQEITDRLVDQHPEPANKQEAVALRNSIRAQACDAVRGVLPVSLEATVGIYGSAQALEGMFMRLEADELGEARLIGRSALEACRQNIGVFLERADKPDRGGAISAYHAQRAAAMRRLVSSMPSHWSKPAGQTKPKAELVRCNFDSELDLVADLLYEYSHKSLTELRQEVDTWNQEQLLAVFKAYMGERLNRRQKPGRALEEISFSWDIVCDYGIFRDLQRHRMVSSLTWQLLTPHMGYEITPLVEEAGLKAVWEDCFQISAELYKLLEEATGPWVAQYAVLLGHHMRWRITYNARQAFHLHELRTSPQGHPNYRRLVGQMHQQIAEIFPHLGEAMQFVNQGEDPELTRLAAERHQQFKLQQLADGQKS